MKEPTLIERTTETLERARQEGYAAALSAVEEAVKGLPVHVVPSGKLMYAVQFQTAVLTAIAALQEPTPNEQ